MNNLLRIADGFDLVNASRQKYNFLGVVSFRYFQELGSGQHYYVDSHCQFAGKQLKLFALNEK